MGIRRRNNASRHDSPVLTKTKQTATVTLVRPPTASTRALPLKTHFGTFREGGGGACVCVCGVRRERKGGEGEGKRYACSFPNARLALTP